MLPRTEGLARDAGSALLWRFPPRRMTAEAIRDSIVQASGSLNPAIGGKSYRIHNVKKRYAQWEVTDNHSEKNVAANDLSGTHAAGRRSNVHRI